MVRLHMTAARTEVGELRSGLLCRQLNSVWVLLRKQDVLMLTFMNNLAMALSPHSQSSTSWDAHAFPSIVDLTLRYQAAKRTRSLKFAKKASDEVSDWYHASKYWLFAHATFARLFLSPRASSRCLPSFASRCRLLGLRRQSLGPIAIGVISQSWAKKNYEEMLAKKRRFSTDEDAIRVLRLKPVLVKVQANSPEQKRAQAGPLSSDKAIRSLPEGSFSGLFRRRATANPFTRASCYSWSSKGHTILTFDRKIRSIPHFLQPPAIDKEPESNPKCM